MALVLSVDVNLGLEPDVGVEKPRNPSHIGIKIKPQLLDTLNQSEVLELPN
jgi:hypothetical protein